MKHYYLLMILINAVIVVLVVFNLYSISTDKYAPTESTDYAEYYDLGCEDADLVASNHSNYFICKDIGALCEIACENLSDARVQASMGKGNTVSCRCYRG